MCTSAAALSAVPVVCACAVVPLALMLGGVIRVLMDAHVHDHDRSKYFIADGQRVCLAQRCARSQSRATWTMCTKPTQACKTPHHFPYQNVSTKRVGWAKAVSAIDCICAKLTQIHYVVWNLLVWDDFGALLVPHHGGLRLPPATLLYPVQRPVILKFVQCGFSVSQLVRHHVDAQGFASFDEVS